jgi:Fe-S cluster biogenesis protein NfuA
VVISSPEEQIALLQKVLKEVIAPLVESDGGELYCLYEPDNWRLHLAGACAGCPGIKTTSREVIEPALRAAGLKGTIVFSAGVTIPKDAQRVQSSESTAK